MFSSLSKRWKTPEALAENFGFSVFGEGEACEDPFKVDFVSDAKCHERVFAAGVPED